MEKDYRYSLIPAILLYFIILIGLNLIYFFKNATGDRFAYFIGAGIIFFSFVIITIFLVLLNKIVNFKKYRVGFISSFIIEEKYCVINIGYEEDEKIKYIQTHKQPYVLYLFLPKIIMNRDEMIGKKVIFFMNHKKTKCFIRHIYKRIY